MEVKAVKGGSEEAAAKEATPKIWKDLKPAAKKAPKVKKASKAPKESADAPAAEPEADKEDTEQAPATKAAKSVKGKSSKGSPDLTPLYKVEKKPAPTPAASSEKEAPTKIVVHIKATEEEKNPENKAKSKAKSAKKESVDSETSLLEKLKFSTPVLSRHPLSSSLDDNDDFQGSVVDFESSVATSKQMMEDKLSGADKIKLPSAEDDDSLI